MDTSTQVATSNSKSLSFFMREQRNEIVKAPAPESFVDENGDRIELEIKVLSQERIQKLFEGYRTRSVATNDRGSPYIGPNNEVMFKTERDTPRAVRHIIAEALVYPDLKSKELMEYYSCHDITEMPLKVFWKSGEYQHVNAMVMNALGLGTTVSNDESLLEEAKN